MPSPKLPEDRGWMGDPRRGASMGRASSRPDVKPAAKVYLKKMPIDRDGYDSGGSYWGIGDPMFWASDDADFELFTRAKNREDAKRIVREKHPEARFYR